MLGFRFLMLDAAVSIWDLENAISDFVFFVFGIVVFLGVLGTEK